MTGYQKKKKTMSAKGASFYWGLRFPGDVLDFNSLKSSFLRFWDILRIDFCQMVENS